MEVKAIINSYDIKRRVFELGVEIQKDFKSEIYIIGLLNGAFIFVSDLIRHIKNPVYVDFMKVSSYVGKNSSAFNIICDTGLDLKYKDVLLVDDILDTGKTLSKVKDILLSKSPKTLKICTLLDKPSRREVPIEADYVGFKIEDRFVIGYGLDYDGFGRNLDFIAEVR